MIEIWMENTVEMDLCQMDEGLFSLAFQVTTECRKNRKLSDFIFFFGFLLCVKSNWGFRICSISKVAVQTLNEETDFGSATTTTMTAEQWSTMVANKQ